MAIVVPCSALSQVFDNFPVSLYDRHLVVDWDNDGDFDIVKINSNRNVDLYEQRDGGQFKKVKPSPFEDITKIVCGPALVDWNDDGLPDVLLATEHASSGFSGVKYYERNRGRLVEKFGDENPFQSIRNISGCGYLSVADWDGDGDKDILMSDLSDTLHYFEQIHGGTFQRGEVGPLRF